MKHLKDSELLLELKSLTQKEREVTADIIRYLKEVDSRALYRIQGYSSLFSFCVEFLGYSASAAMRRMKAARVVDETVLEKLEEGSLSLCAITEVTKVSDPVVREELFRKAEGQSKEVVSRLVAEYLPPVKPRESIKPVRVIVPEMSALPLFKSPAEATPQPKTAVLHTVTFSVTEEELKVLLELRALSGSQTQGQAIMKAAKAYVLSRSPEARMRRRKERREKRDLKPTEIATTGVVTRHIPVPVREAVCSRDNAQCTFVGSDGHRCREKHALQADHIKPWAFGGEHQEDNLRMLCPSHHRLVGEKVFGNCSKVKKLRGGTNFGDIGNVMQMDKS